MYAVRQTDAFVIPPRRLLECSRCGGLIKGVLKMLPFLGIEGLLFRCPCQEDNPSLGILLTPEGIPAVNLRDTSE